MSRLTISMPEQMNDWVQEQVSNGRYGNISEYFRDLVRRDQERRGDALRELRELIDRAEAAGAGGRKLPEVLEAAREEARHILKCAAEDGPDTKRAAFLAESDRLRKSTPNREHTPAEVLIREDRAYGHREP